MHYTSTGILCCVGHQGRGAPGPSGAGEPAAAVPPRKRRAANAAGAAAAGNDGAGPSNAGADQGEGGTGAAQAKRRRAPRGRGRGASGPSRRAEEAQLVGSEREDMWAHLAAGAAVLSATRVNWEASWLPEPQLWTARRPEGRSVVA